VEIQPEVKVRSREKERERRRKRERDTGGARAPRNQAGRLVREAGPRSWPLAPGPWPPGPLAPWPHPLLFRRPFILFDKTQRSMGNTRLCSVRSSGSFYTSFGIQKVSGDLHYLLAKRLVNTFWLSSLMNVNLVSPEVFFFNLHLL
jgi:hypothetical protein